ncbi:hypothetical protein HN51_069811 [Arachis hypogaea]
MHHLGAVLYHIKTDGEGGDGVVDASDGVETEGDGAVGEYCGEPMGAVPVPVGGCEIGEVLYAKLVGNFHFLLGMFVWCALVLQVIGFLLSPSNPCMILDLHFHALSLHVVKIQRECS